MKTVSDHLKRFPNARPSTLAHLELRSRKTEQLRQEVEVARKVNEFRDSIDYHPGMRPIEVVMACARGLKRLALIGRV